jgi:hypothetical protein
MQVQTMRTQFRERAASKDYVTNPIANIANDHAPETSVDRLLAQPSAAYRPSLPPYQIEDKDDEDDAPVTQEGAGVQMVPKELPVKVTL